jgi:hypothetical protein
MLKSLFILYIIILILQISLTVIISPSESEKRVNSKNKIIYNIEHETELTKEFSKQVLEIASKLNSGEMTYSQWREYIATIPKIDKGEFQYYVSVWEYFNGASNGNDFLLIKYGSSDYEDLTFIDFQNDMKEISVNSKKSVTESLPQYCYTDSVIGKVNFLNYYWVDPLSLESVRKKLVCTRYEDKKSGKSGFVTIGLDIENVSLSNSFKYLYRINKFLFAVTSLATLIIALVIYNYKSTVNYLYISIGFLIISNIFIFLFVSTSEYESTISNENLKSDRISSGILSISFLTGINIYILKSLFDNTNTFFKETAFIFGVAMIMIFFSAYNYKSTNDLYGIISNRVTKQFTFNFGVFLNAFILLNFLLYTVSLKKLINFKIL